MEDTGAGTGPLFLLSSGCGGWIVGPYALPAPPPSGTVVVTAAVGTSCGTRSYTSLSVIYCEVPAGLRLVHCGIPTGLRVKYTA